ncbi:MAG: hypothetical protein ACU0BS_06915 [Hasllibacter sp.]
MAKGLRRLDLVTLGMVAFVLIYGAALRARWYLPPEQTAGRVELFPFFSWSLFSYPHRRASLYGLARQDREGRLTDIPTTDIRLQKLGTAAAARGALTSEARGQFVGYATEHGPGRYVVVRRVVDPLARGDGAVIEREVLFDLGDVR